MKKIISLALALLMLLALVACSSSAETDEVAEAEIVEAQSYEIALITDIGTVEDKSFNEGAWKGVLEFVETNDVSYTYLSIPEESDTARNETIISAIDNGAKVIVCPGYLFASAIYELQSEYPEVMFLGLDISEADVIAITEDVRESYLEDNVCLITYKEEQAGYLAGYAAVKDGYTKLAFLGGMEMPAVIRYGNGFIEGADTAAAELGIDIEIKHWYSGTFLVDDAVQIKTDEWFSNGTEIVFSCGGNIYVNALDSATECGGYLIGVDSDQSSISELFLSSATKDLTATTATALTALYENGGTWSADYGAQVLLYGASENSVALPTDESAWRFSSFTVEEYEALFAKIAAGEIEISDDIENPVATTNATVDYQN